MSPDYYRKLIKQLTKKKADLEKDLAQEHSKAGKLRSEIATLRSSVTPRTSPSTVRMKERQIDTKQTALSRHEKKAAELEGKLSPVIGDLNRALSNLERVEKQEQSKRDAADKRRRSDELGHAKNVTRELKTQAQLQRELGESRFVIDLKELPETITVLFVAANPDAENALELDEEMRAIKQRVRASEYREAIRMEDCWAARAADLLQGLNEHKPHIVHFSGHGSPNGELVFKRDDGSLHRVSPEAIAQTFATAGNADLCLGIFNACFSEAQAEAVTEHIPLAIGMSDAIGDSVAREFAAQFYSALGFGHSVGRAFGQARAAAMLESIDEQNTSQLFARPGVNPDLVVLVRPPDT
jgi:hypothetical protein